MTEFVKDDHMTLVANKDYWGGAPNAETVILKPKTEPAARVAALLAGEVNLIDQVPTDQLERVKGAANLKTANYTYLGFVALVLNSSKPPLDNKLVKQAMSLAIDRQTIVKELLRGQGVVSTGFVPPGDFGFNPGRPPLPFNTPKARELLKQAGYKGEEIGCEVTQTDLPLLEAVAAMWKSAGINAKIQLVDNAVRAQKIREKTYAVLVAYPGSTLGDPDGLIWRTLAPGGLFATWRDPEFDRLGDESRFLLDPEKRRQNYERMQDMLVENFPWIPLHQPVYSYAMHRTIQWRPSASSTVDFRRDNLSFSS
jgi:peptide/nickel transport system substrate-binding protein